MKTFYLSFLARLVGSIGVTYPQFVEIEANDLDEATLKLYDRFEHISKLELSSEWATTRQYHLPIIRYENHE